MPLTYQVLRCFKCLVFQVHPTKKGRKWACKMCGEIQSIKRFYSLGTAKECRLHVQTLNGIRGEIEDTKCTQDLDLSDVSNSPNIPKQETVLNSSTSSNKSKWEDFLDANNEENQLAPDENKSLNNTEVVSEQLKKRLKKAHKNKCTNKIPNKSNHSPPAKLENNFTKRNPVDFNKPVTLIYKAKPNILDVTASKQCKVVKPVFPPVESNLKWAQFVKEFNLDDPLVNNEDRSRSEPSEWFSSINDEDLDAILEF